MTPSACIVDALRSPTGKRNGSLANMHPMDLGAHVIRTLVERQAIPAEDYDDVIFGTLDAIGPQSGNLARFCWLGAGLPESVPGVTIDRQCGSSQQALHFAAQAVMSGTQDVVIAGGVQNMSRIPIGAAWGAARDYGFPDPWSTAETFKARYGNQQLSQFTGAEAMAQKWGLSREAMEVFGLESNNRALRAIAEGRFDRELAPLPALAMDETARASSLEKMAALKTILPDGRLTAAVASQVSDGASAMLVCSEAALKRYNLKPRARLVHMSVRGDDPVMMLSAPIPATRHALQKAGMRIQDIDLAEVNEAFAPVPMAWMKELGFPHDKTNVNGGAIALGHPLGASGTKLMTTLLHEPAGPPSSRGRRPSCRPSPHWRTWSRGAQPQGRIPEGAARRYSSELERRGARYGLQTMCEGGGLANVTIIERL